MGPVQVINLSIIISSGIMIASFLITSFWNTNDEVGTVMAVTGFGGFYRASEFLQYSNNLYGLLIKNFPDLLGYNRYVWIVLLEMFISSLIIFYYIQKNNLNNKLFKYIGVLFCMFFMVKIALFPQFTILSGLVFIAGYILFLSNNLKPLSKSWKLFLGLTLIFLSSLIRFELFLLIFFIFSPYIYLSKINISKILALLITLILIVSANFWSKNKYNSEEWSEWSGWQKERVYWIDNGGFSKLLLHPEIYQKYQYSENDIKLLNSWFFADKKLMDVERLTKIRAELDLVTNNSYIFKNIRKSIKFFFSKNIYFFTLLSLIATFFFFSKISLLSIFFTIFAFVYIGYIGRPGEERVYIPIIFGLFLFPLIFNKFKIPAILIFLNEIFIKFYNEFKFLFLSFIFFKKNIKLLLIILIFSFSFLFSLLSIHKEHYKKYKNIQVELNSLSNLDDYIVVWGASFPYVESLPLNTRFSHTKLPKIYILGTPTLNPYSYAHFYEERNNGFKDKFLSTSGLYIISDINGIGMLDIYCKSNFIGKFSYSKVDGFKYLDVYKVNCLN